MQFEIPYQDKTYAVSLALLGDGYFSAHNAAYLETLCSATLAPGDAERDFSTLYRDTQDAVLVLNMAMNVATEQGRAGGWEQGDGTVVPYPWASWGDVPRESTEAVLRAALTRIDAESDAIAEMEDFYASDDAEGLRRNYRFRNSIDRVFWRFCQASTNLSEAHTLWRAYSRHAVEHYLILKNLMGEKPDDSDAGL
jgi:hypothetical protein